MSDQGDPMRNPANTMKVWSRRELVSRASPREFDVVIEQLETKVAQPLHCLIFVIVKSLFLSEYSKNCFPFKPTYNMKPYSIISILMLLTITACNSNTSESEQVKPSQEKAVVQYMTPGQKSIHLFNLPEGVSEEQLSTSLSEMNAAISELGYPGAGYHMYKVESDTIQEYRYFMEGLWPDAEAYRIIHESENWKQAAEKNSEMTKKLFSGPIYLYRKLLKVKMGE